MLKDITLGQYVPGETVVHRLDPRTKILVMLAYIVITFCVQNFAGYAVLAAFVVGTVAISRAKNTIAATSHTKTILIPVIKP